jgi:hypothetical protein
MFVVAAAMVGAATVATKIAVRTFLATFRL